MTIKTLKHIHRLLQDDVDHKTECHERNRKAWMLATDYLDEAKANGCAEDIRIGKEALHRAKEDYDYTYKLLQDAEDAMQDFETHDFR